MINSSATFRIEDLNPIELVKALGMEDEVDSAKLPSKVPRDPHHTSPVEEKIALPDVTWSDLHKTDVEMAKRIFNLAKEFGYESGKESIEDVM